MWAIVTVGNGLGINLGSVDTIARYWILSITKRTRAGEVVLIDIGNTLEVIHDHRTLSAMVSDSL
jgi:hypothetical protein